MNYRLHIQLLVSLCLVLVLTLTGCAQSSSSLARESTGSDKLQVVATTTIVADIVQQVGGQAVEVSSLIPAGADPHAFEPSPRDIAIVADAQAVFMSGGGLEAFMESTLRSAGGSARVIVLSEDLIAAENQTSEDHDLEGEADHLHAGDPHVWMDPNNVMDWVAAIETSLQELDPANAELYEANAAAYSQKLQELDAWIRQQVEQIPAENRKLVTDHQIFGAFASRYGFEQVGAVIPSISSSAEPTAQELAALEDAIRAQGVHAIFISSTVNQNLAQQVAHDTGIQLVTLYTDSLTGPEGPASSYLEFIRYNVSEIVNALK
ncbi:MAG: zinc ABC transporter substrate-binding protein [Chloroflexi bacterium]|jgi:manganese/iron transport system substrate-binding protein|nr:zinc ABC transporter substrate-binding protein [Chloroflexota bacterium]